LHFKEVYKNKFAGADLLTSTIMYFLIVKKNYPKCHKRMSLELEKSMQLLFINILNRLHQERFIFIIKRTFTLEI
jgi:hypothetical protein